MYGDQWRHQLENELTSASGVDLAVAAGAGAARLARAAIVRPLAATAWEALRLGERVLLGGPGHPLVATLAARGDLVRSRLEREAADVARVVLRRTVEWAVTSLDLTELVRAHVDLDALARGIDVDGVVARADVDAVVARLDLDAALERIDLDAVAAQVDLDAVLSRIDVDTILARIDLDAVLSRIDVDTIVAGVDLDAVLTGVDVDRIASRIDLDAILARIEPDAVLVRVDLDAVLARLDLPAITREVIDAIDLPEMLRQSTGAVSSQAARTVRTEGMNADESVARFVDRVLRRPHPRGAVP